MIEKDRSVLIVYCVFFTDCADRMYVLLVIFLTLTAAIRGFRSKYRPYTISESIAVQK